jgi:hypothetical protein
LKRQISQYLGVGFCHASKPKGERQRKQTNMARNVTSLRNGERHPLGDTLALRPDDLMLSRIETLAKGMNKLPKRSQDRACELMEDAVNYGLSAERLVEMDKLIENIRRRKRRW